VLAGLFDRVIGFSFDGLLELALGLGEMVARLGVLDLPLLRALRSVLDLGELRFAVALGAARLLRVALADRPARVDLVCVVAASPEGPHCGELLAVALGVAAPAFGVSSEAFDVALELLDLTSCFDGVAVNDRLEAVALGTPPLDGGRPVFAVGGECELPVFTLELLFVGEWDADRRQVRFGRSLSSPVRRFAFEFSERRRAPLAC